MKDVTVRQYDCLCFNTDDDLNLKTVRRKFDPGEISQTQTVICCTIPLIKCSEQVNPQRQKADYWLPEAGGKESDFLTGMGFVWG